jgi:hypothetical protein
MDQNGFRMFRPEVNSLRHLINSPSSGVSVTNDIVELTRYLNDRIDDRKYADELFLELRDRVFGNADPSLFELRRLSQLLATEYVAKGFAVESVVDMPDSLFSKGRLIERGKLPVFKGKFWGTNLECHLDPESPIKEKFEFVRTLFYAPAFRARVCLMVLGAWADNHETVRYGDVTFHPPLTIEGEGDEKLWVFSFIDNQRQLRTSLRASITQKGRDCYSMLNSGKREIEKAVDFLSYRYLQSRHEAEPVCVSNSWALLAEDGSVIHQMPRPSEAFPQKTRYHSRIPMTELCQEEIERMEAGGSQSGLRFEVISKNKLNHVFHWIRKAENADQTEDVFMNLWIAMEFLVRQDRVNVFEAIQDYVIPIFVNEFFDELIDNLHRLYEQQVANGYLRIDDDALAARYVYSDQSDQLFRSYPTAFRSEATMV